MDSVECEERIELKISTVRSLFGLGIDHKFVILLVEAKSQERLLLLDDIVFVVLHVFIGFLSLIISELIIDQDCI